MKRTPFGVTRKVEEPYAIYKNDRAGWEWRILKTYQRPDKEASNVYARWFVAAKSPYTFGGWEMGDTYISEVTTNGTLVSSIPEWKEHYTGDI
tara:strand:- start:1580 stop:1858 length:279 start_codon:yes stop_codon:yes gene_type:complete